MTGARRSTSRKPLIALPPLEGAGLTLPQGGPDPLFQPAAEAPAAPAQIVLPYSPHAAQKTIHRTAGRIKAIRAGRRFGKDRCSLNEFLRRCFEMAAEERPAHLIPRVHGWVVAPTFPMLRQIWNELRTFLVPTGLITRKDESELTLELQGGIFIELKSADRPETLVGVGLDIVWITEAARIREVAWTEGIRPTLSSPQRGPGMVGQGLAIVNSTPRGRNWFFQLCMAGTPTLPDGSPNALYDPAQGVVAFHYTTLDNPLINPVEVEIARQGLAEVIFRQEYLAEFVDDVGAVFINLAACRTGLLEPPQAGHAYVMGMDIAYLKDWSVLVVLDLTDRRVVHVERFRDSLFDVQAARLKHAVDMYKPLTVAVDGTGVGVPAVRQLRQLLTHTTRVQGVYYTADTKERLVQQLQLAFQQRTVIIPEGVDNDWLFDELASYEFQVSKSGRFTYSAPPGQHDDGVNGLMLSLEAARMPGWGVSEEDTLF